MKTCLAGFLAMLLATGCVPRYHNGLSRHPDPTTASPKRVVYSDDLRGVASQPFSFTRKSADANDGVPPESLTPVFHPTGRKIASLEEFETLRSEVKKIDDKITFGEIVVSPIVTAGSLVLMASASALTVAGILTMPYWAVRSSRAQKTAFQAYEEGVAALEAKRPTEALAAFERALGVSAQMAQESDIHFQMARAYEAMGNPGRALDEYRRFLQYSVRLYPRHFERRDDTYTNNFSALKSRFEEAEKKLASR